MLSTPAREFPEFPAALANAALLDPEDVLRQLTRRAATLEERLAARAAELDQYDLPRLFLLEEEFARTVAEAELQWVRALIADLQSGALTWDHEFLHQYQ